MGMALEYRHCQLSIRDGNSGLLSRLFTELLGR